ncbi:MAG: UDP-N-acetylmuramoyl-tripeptide--D-alanyl-D-alanine ligase [Treponema sp.]|nr:UDP-N-acetylmuramoyl-tripeptide--D-alanyl-D-alanine ligase [Treponema sp.]
MACDNGVLMTFTELSQSLGADMLSCGPCSGEAGFSSVSIDSRTVQNGGLFVALPGAVHDGHSFVEQAFKNGAAAAMVERQKVETFNIASLARAMGKAVIIVESSLRGLQDAARVYLRRFPRLVKIAITGSSGKTTTKEITAAIAGVEKNTVMNPGNYNSDTGLPLAAFNVRSCHEVGVFECGMNRAGEIAELAAVLNPDIALITNIGSAHIGILGSKEAIAEEKRKIFSRMGELGTSLIPADSPFRDFLSQGVRGKVSFYGERSFAELGGVRDLGLDGSEIIWDGQKARFSLPGRHNLANAFAAIAAAREIPVSAQAIRGGLESVKPLFGRGEILRGRATVVQDCYNSNPESAARALELCNSLDWPGRRLYVMGEMLELGENSKAAHEEMGRLLLNSKADMVFLFGEAMRPAAEIVQGGALRVMHTCDMDELSRALDACVRPDDLVLLKGSRGCALERLCTVLTTDGRAA